MASNQETQKPKKDERIWRMGGKDYNLEQMKKLAAQGNDVAKEVVKKG